MNKGATNTQYQVSATGIDGLEIVLGMNKTIIEAGPGQLVTVPIKIQADKYLANKKIHTIEVNVVAKDDDGSNSDTASEKVKYFGYDK